MTARALADTSVLVASELGRRLDALPEELAVSVVTLGELHAGVLAAADTAVRASRMATFTRALDFDPLPVDEAVAAAWAELRARLRDHRRRMPVNDSWIAATALAHRLPVVTQDDDFDAVDWLEVIKV